MSERPFVFVTVGTDAFPFDRLMRWVEAWAVAGGVSRAEVLVQHGSSRPPAGVASVPFLSHRDMQDALDRASVVVCHGGPSALEAHERGVIPLVVPRTRELGEAVDDHQVLFSERLAGDGSIKLVGSERSFAPLLDTSLADPTFVTYPLATARRPDAVPAFARAVEPLLGRSGSTPVLYIGGTERSGSTLLDRILGQLDGFASVGEVVHLWERGVVLDQRCGCGERFHACPFWRLVGDRAYGGWDQVDGRAIVDAKRQVDRHRFLPWLLAPKASRAFRRKLDRFVDVVEPLYAAIAEVTGSIVVDSSKSSSYLFLLRRAARVDLRLVQLVRDPRGVAYSESKQVERPEIVDGTDYMPTYRPARSAVDWTSYNALFDLARATGTPGMRTRYESLLAAPRREVGRIVRFAGLPAADRLDALEDHVARLEPTHSVSGNPVRFRNGDVPLRLDEEWREHLPAPARATVTTLTAPLLRRYGYAA